MIPYTPTHLQMSETLHRIIADKRRLYALKEAGILDRAEEVRLDLEYWNMFWYNSRETGNSNTLPRPDTSISKAYRMPRNPQDFSALEER